MRSGTLLMARMRLYLADSHWGAPKSQSTSLSGELLPPGDQ